MPIKRLMIASGLIESAEPAQVVDDVMTAEVVALPLERCVRSCIMIHAGHNGAEIELAAITGSLTFDDARIEEIVVNQNARLDDELTSHYESFDLIPIGAFPPVLDAHDDQSSVQKVIGRMTSKLRFERRDIPKVGKNVACACAEITFLGRETVERVLDGRIYHLSIGIDEESNTLTELSAVIEPAAPGAMVLKKGSSQKSKGATMPTAAQIAKKKETIAALKSAKQTLATLSGKMVKTTQKMNLEAAKKNVVARLTGVMKGGKLLRSEFTKMPIAKLAAVPKEHLEVLIETMECMEPKIQAGQVGSTQAMEFSTMGKQLEKRQKTQLRAEIRGDMAKLGAKLKGAKAEKEDDDKKPSKFGSDTQDKMKKLADKPDDDKKLGDKSPDDKKLAGEDDDADTMEADSTVPVVDQGEGGLPEMQKQIDELNTQIARVAGIVSDLLEDSQAEEGGEDDGEADLGSEDDKDSKLNEDPEKKDDAKLAEDDDSDQDKNKDAKPPVKKEGDAEDDKEDDKK